jgi:hypothetical protein
MNSRLGTLNYDLYGESEWRLLFFDELLRTKSIIDPRDASNKMANAYFNSLRSDQQQKLKYLLPLDGWFAMIIYPSGTVKNEAQWRTEHGIREEIMRIKSKLDDHGNRVEGGSWPIEVELDACRHF